MHFRSRVIVAAALSLLIVTACTTARGPTVNLNEGGAPASEAPLRSALGAPFRFAIAPLLSPDSNLAAYKPFLKYLERRLGRPVELVQRKTYAEVNDLVKTGAVDAALVCGGAYIHGFREFGMELLAAPVRQGQALYYSILVVPASSEVKSLADLEGKSFAFTDPLSHSGRIAPTYALLGMGRDPDNYFSRQVFTYSHENSIRAVAQHLVDGAAVHSWVYEGIVAAEPSIAASTKVVARWGPFSSAPVVVNPRLSPEIKAEFGEILYGMAADPSGQPVLSEMGIDGFTPVGDSSYEEIRRMSDATEHRAA